MNGAAPPDEVNLVTEGADFGWPGCFGNQQPALNFGGTEEGCQATVAAAATFPPQSTPTSIVASPWEADTLLVVLWGPTEPRIVRLPLANNSGATFAQSVEPFISGMKNPQSLLVLPDGSLLASDFTTGTIYRVTRGE